MVSDATNFPPFSLARLLRTVFGPKSDEKVAILIDLDDPSRVTGFGFLKDESLTIQRLAHDVFYQGLKNGGLEELGWSGGELYAYQLTGGSNLDMADLIVDIDGNHKSFEADIYPHYDIVLCISTYSATAPLTAFAKKYGFRGATLHGLNEIILSSGLSVDYNEVGEQAEKLRLALTAADFFEVDFVVGEESCTLKIHCDRQEAQKSHGLCRGPEPDVANLPAGEVYFVPTDAEGMFPMKYSDGTIGKMSVSGGKIAEASLLTGSQDTVDAHNRKLAADPVTGELGELGFGTQVLPVSGRDIQDEKILGTMHVATGRSDHLGGHLTPDLFAEAQNATHDDILFSPTKTPEIRVAQVRMTRNGTETSVIEDFEPTDYLLAALNE
ncbi:MAG: hypothetical protein M2R45_01334 [Verrucomicrobia subdivision 3 bacterium]|nr:hypothetical protein [Limisphaerales bacterium]MCS1415200.1 hypothetical protein [Limisphaerales bacterium]